jgi:phosphate-selective porin OprO and OprP
MSCRARGGRTALVAAMWLAAGTAAIGTAASAAAQEPSLEERVERLEAAAAGRPAAEAGDEAATKPEAAPAAPATDDDWTFRWKDTFRLASPDGAFQLKLGGRIQADWAAISGDDAVEAALGDLEGGSEFRRARLYFEGLLYERVEFKAQYDFAGGAAEFKDVYLGLVDVPVVGAIRVGHFKEPWSLEEQTSSKYLTFMERSPMNEAWSPSRNTGFMIHDGTDRLRWAAGAFLPADDFGNAPETDEWGWTGRITGLPWRAGDDRFLHLGAAASRRDPVDDAARFRSRPEAHLAPRFVDTGNLATDGVTLLGLEAAWVHGPYSLQGEWSQAAVDRPGAADADLAGHYLFASWFLTGESRPYDDGAFGRVKPARPFGTGPGAWEVAARWSSLDLDDAGVAGGQLDDLTLGLNWYLYSNVRWMLNYVLADLEGVGDADVVEMRFQIDF